ncbi:MAG TPA: hypothetical protein DEP69_05835, partial [Acidimicrobiaceae bacterium]|nr:hypothetical protein [Acidimicrobiaceae bacterium]
VSDVEEAGTVTITPSGVPRVGDRLTAALDDPDGGVRGTTWRWSSKPAGGGYTDIAAGTGASYTVRPVDAGKVLRATAAYDDGEGTGKTAGGSANAVPANTAPTVAGDAEPPEFAEGGSGVVADYTATDDTTAVGDLEWSLGGGDA